MIFKMTELYCELLENALEEANLGKALDILDEMEIAGLPTSTIAAYKVETAGLLVTNEEK